MVPALRKRKRKYEENESSGKENGWGKWEMEATSFWIYKEKGSSKILFSFYFSLEAKQEEIHFFKYKFSFVFFLQPNKRK